MHCTETGQRFSAALQEAVESLRPRDLEILKSIYFDGIAQNKLAKQLGVAPPRISFLNARVLSRVRRHVLEALPDDTSAYWLEREGLAIVLKDVIARILDKGQ